MNFKKIQSIVYEEYKKNDYLKMWGDAQKVLKFFENGPEIVDVAEVGLISEEVGEAEREIRKGRNPKYELADIIIRTLNFASRKGIDVEQAILEKHEKNMKREKRHGRKV